MPPISARSVLPSSRPALGLVAALLALGIVLALSPASASAAPGPVADYSFDAGSGTTVEDLTGHGHTATIEEGAWARGRDGGAISFTGGGKKCVSTPDAADLRLSKAFTIEAWVRPVGGVFGDPVVVRESEGKTAYGLGLGSRTEGMAEGFIGEGKTSKAAVATDEAREYAWTNIATTYDGSTLRVYVDGELSGSQATTTAAATGSGALKIGCDTPDGQFTGRIDEVRIYNRALPEKEVRRDMATPLQTPLAGPVADYSFDKDEGETAADGTGHGHTATVEGATWTGKGKYGGGYEFDGSGEDVLKIPDSPQLDFTEEFTLEAWVRPSGAENRYAPLIDKQAGGGLGYFLYEGGSVSDRPVGAAEEEQEFVDADQPLDAHAWSHVALTFAGNRTYLYVDGELVDNGAAEPISVTKGDLEIGGSTSTADWFDGKIDEVRVYDRALSEGEIQADMATPIQTPKTGPLVEYSFDEGEGETVVDLSGHGHEATIEGAEWAEGRYGGSLRFGGEDMLTIPASEELDLTEEFTLEAWVKPEAEAAFGHLFVKEDAAEDNAAYVITREEGRLGAFLGVPEEERWTAGESLPVGIWQHVTVTYDGARVRLYLDGHLEESGPVDAILPTDGPLRIGDSKVWPDGFTGKIDQVKIYGRALDQAEVDDDKSPRQGPVAAWTFNENEGAAAGDISGDGHTGAIEGAEWTEGKYGRALKFAGKGMVGVPASEELDLTDEFTLEAWIRPESSSEYGDLFVKENAGQSKSAYVITDHKGRLGAYLGSPEVKYQSKEGTLPTNTWTYVAVTDSGYHVRLYINGELVETGAAPKLIGTDGKLRIGGSAVRGPGDDFTGKIDEARVYDRSLSEAQIESDMRNDFTPPEVELSGALTEGLKEGVTEYPLHVHAVDGKAGFPGVGVKSITISVDGTVVKTVEQECEAGNCAMETGWTFDTEEFPGEHTVTVSAADQAQNSSSTTLELALPDGAIQACKPLNGSNTYEPSETISLPGGGSMEVYKAKEGTYEFPNPPSSFEPLSASNSELEEYGFPARPAPLETEQLAEWEELMSGYTGVSPGGICTSPASNGTGAVAAGSSNNQTLENYSGFRAWEESGKDVWKGIKAWHVVAEKNPDTCSNDAIDQWVGLGGKENGALIQGGSKVNVGGYFHAFINRFKAGGPYLGDHVVRMEIEPGDLFYTDVEWLPNPEIAKVIFKDKRTGKIRPVLMKAINAKFYDGSAGEFIDERPENQVTGEYLSLYNYHLDEWTRAHVENNAGQWKKLGEVPRRRVMMGKTGRILSEPGGVRSDEMSFLDHWRHCR